MLMMTEDRDCCCLLWVISDLDSMTSVDECPGSSLESVRIDSDRNSMETNDWVVERHSSRLHPTTVLPVKMKRQSGSRSVNEQICFLDSDEHSSVYNTCTTKTMDRSIERITSDRPELHRAVERSEDPIHPPPGHWRSDSPTKHSLTRLLKSICDLNYLFHRVPTKVILMFSENVSWTRCSICLRLFTSNFEACLRTMMRRDHRASLFRDIHLLFGFRRTR